MHSIILHGHIFKNAGTTFDWSLARNFGTAFLDHRDDKAMRERRADHLAELVSSLPDLRALSSHFLCYPPPDLENFTFHTVYLLRHPLERIGSVYAFERYQDATTPGALAAKKMNFRDYVAWRMQPEVPRTIRDYQTCYVIGQHDHRPRHPTEARWLSRALAHLGASRCVGVVDRYDESMVVFEQQLSAVFPDIDLSYVAQNVTRRKRREDSLDEKVRRVLQDVGEQAGEVLRQNSLDLALYRHANQLLDARIAEISNFEARLAAFRGRCSRLQQAG